MLVSGHTVTPSIFWCLVNASFLPEDHQKATSQKMILTCLTHVHQKPENYHKFFVDNAIPVPPKLKQGFQKATQKRAHRKGGSTRKSQLIGGGGANRLVGVDGDGNTGTQHGGGPEDRRNSNMSVALGGSSRHGGGGLGAPSECGSDDMSDTMSVFSVLTQHEGNITS